MSCASFLFNSKNKFTPMLKLLAYKKEPFLFSQSDLISSQCSSQPVLPLTTGTPISKHCVMFFIAAFGFVNSMATSAIYKD